MRKNHIVPRLAAVILTLLLISNVSPIMIGSEPAPQKILQPLKNILEQNQKVAVTCQTFGYSDQTQHQNYLNIKQVQLLQQQIQHLKEMLQTNHTISTIRQLQNELFHTLQQYQLIPNNLDLETIQTSKIPSFIKQISPSISMTETHATATFCNFLTTGVGSAFPIIILPRLIPFLLTPIPRLFVRWKTDEGITSCGSLTSGKGFIAIGMQNGFALGFWGVGFSIFIPPLYAYGLFGYALFTSVNAEHIEPWPPNEPPEITPLNPPDNSQNISISTSELEFSLTDINRNLMNYTVTTQPDIGSGSATNVQNGVFTIPISGLEGTETYTWTIQADDGTHHIQETYSFETEPVAPVVLNPEPYDNEKYVPITTSHLKFTLKDYQGDPMDYTVETHPDIGSGSATNVPDGTYIIPITNLQNLTTYTWYVNVTDGTNWKHKTYTFQTEPQMTFDPFQEGWQYRKQITIDHTQVTGDLTNFPILISTTDIDLRDKAQFDGDDILFMDGAGVANRLFHEIEDYDGSSGSLVAWVNIPFLNSSVDTDFYMYYGNPSIDNQEVPEFVWDNDFLTVLHMNDSSGNPYDSTSNHEIWQVKNGGTLTYHDNGQIGYAIKGEYAENDGNRFENFGMDWRSLTAVTMEWWFAFDDITQTSCRFGADGENMEDIRNSFSYNSETQKNGWVETWDDGTDRTLDGRLYNWNNGEFHYGAAILDNTGSNYQGIYTDGTLTISTNPSDFNFANLNNQFYIGSRAPERGKDHNFDGWLDEFRISKVRRSDAWINTSYNTMNDPSNFYIVGPEET